MPTARHTRTIAAPAQELWETIGDPHHLPRWWPRVSRVEDVTESAFTEVLSTKSGRFVRADFHTSMCSAHTVSSGHNRSRTAHSRAC